MSSGTGKVRGHGSANVGVAVIPGGVPHLDGANIGGMEEKIRKKAGAGAGVVGRDAAADVELRRKMQTANMANC